MYKSRNLVSAVVFIMFTALLRCAFADDVERRQIIAVKIETPPKIDGSLDDPIWEKAQPSGGFLQTHPDRGEPMTELTVVRILYDDENIYVGLQCYDSEPEKIVATEMRRDHNIWETNDYISCVFDTHHDLRTGYYFATNPLGAQVDARVTANGNLYRNWDAVWDCAATRHSRGWSAEFSIPFRQLRFPVKEKHVWGFNCERTLRHCNNEEGCWTSIPTKYIMVISNAGELVGLEDIPQGHQLEMRPAVVGGAQANYDGKTDVDSVRELSLDVKYGLTSGLTLDATLNTDFAQIEADEERVNLSRFDLFFQEKRPFFLEGVGTFRTPILLFYTRRIGSEGDKEVPILGGLKLTGKLDKQSLGLLSVLTGETGEVPRTTFSALRVERDILKSSSAGIIFLNKSPWEDNPDNQTLGIDLQFNPREEVNISGSLAKTWTDGLHGRDLAGQINGSWSTNFSDFSASFTDIQKNFNPEMGFVPRKDIQSGNFFGSKLLQIRKGIFRSLRYGGSYGMALDHDGHLQYRNMNLSLGLNLETDDGVGMWCGRDWQRLDEDWEIREGIVIPASIYRFNEYSIHAGMAQSRWLRAGCALSGGGFYNGHRYSLSLDGHIRPIPQLLVTGGYSRNFIDLPDGDFTTNTINSRWVYSFSSDFFIKLFLQWNDDSDIVRGNFLLRYRYQPGSDFYIVYNERWRADKVEQRFIVAKITYFLNF